MKNKCDQCEKLIEKTKDFSKVSIVKKGKAVSEKKFCSSDCAKKWTKTYKKAPLKETLEEEIKEAIEEEKEHVEEAQKIAEQQDQVTEIKQEVAAYGKKEIPQFRYLAEEKPQTEYIENQDFYIKNKKDFDTIKNTMQELKAQDSGMSRVDDSDLWEIEPETKKLKIRKMPRTILDMLKQKQIVLDYYKML